MTINRNKSQKTEYRIVFFCRRKKTAVVDSCRRLGFDITLNSCSLVTTLGEGGARKERGSPTAVKIEHCLLIGKALRLKI